MKCQEHNWIGVDWEIEWKYLLNKGKLKGVYFFCSNCQRQIGLHPELEGDKYVFEEN